MAQLLQNALYGTALILAAAALRLVLKGRLTPEARLALWAVCLLRLLAPAAPESALSLWGLFVRRSPASAPARVPQPYAPAPSPGVPVPQPSQAPQLYIPAGGAAYVPAPPAESAGAAFPWGAALLGLWLAVGLVLAARYVLDWTRTRRAVACATPVGRGDPRYAPLPKCARLREGAMEGAPLTFGALRPTVVLPPGLSGEALDCVLAHEGAHARRRDNLWHYAMALALALHWWNPAVWLMARLLRRDIELSCDRAALKKLGAGRRADYANALVSLASQGGGSAFSHAFGRKLTEERITAIMKYKKMTALGVALSLLLVCGVTVVFATAPVESPPEPLDSASVLSGCNPDFVDGEAWEAQNQQFMELMRQRIQDELDGELGCSPEELAARASCRHPSRKFSRRGIFFTPKSNLVHLKTVCDYWRCNDCGTVIDVPGDTTLEAHNFGPAFYAGSNHGLADPSLHFAIYNHTCPDCTGTYMSYTSATGCTQYGCVDVQSVTPEPGVDSAAPAGAENDVYEPCADQGCPVAYDHCHIDGEVVRVYYENPGLLCAHPDCGIEGPHEHDGVRYAGQAGRFVILGPEVGPVPSAAPAEGGAALQPGPVSIPSHDAEGNVIGTSAVGSGQGVAVGSEPSPGGEPAGDEAPQFTGPFKELLQKQWEVLHYPPKTSPLPEPTPLPAVTAPPSEPAPAASQPPTADASPSPVPEPAPSYPPCPYENCVTTRPHSHDASTIYSCSGFHSGGVCDGRHTVTWKVNSKGHTYGPTNRYGTTYEEVHPDLVEIVPSEYSGWQAGYILETDSMWAGYPNAPVNTTEEAMAYMEWSKNQPEWIPIPLRDCEENIIGQFFIYNSESCLD